MDDAPRLADARGLMRGSSHEALALGAAYGGLEAFSDLPMDTRALPLAAMSIAALGAWEAVATQRQKGQVKHLKAWERGMRERGLTSAHIEGLKMQGGAPSVRWKGPPRKVSQPLRLLALLCAFTVAIPIGVALATARLPDLLEVGPIPHRGPTHWLMTAAVLIVGVALAMDAYLVAATWAVTTGLAIGYLSHLAADGCTLSGVPFLWPAYRDDLHLLPRPLRVRTGSLVDTAIAFAALAAVVLVSQPAA